MKLAVSFLIFCSLFLGCESNRLPAEQLSKISVVRETLPTSNILQTNQPKVNTAAIPSPTYQKSKAKYHIIVASFGAKEKAKAEKMVSELKAKDHPASVIYSSQRYRVSIEGYASEAKANAARDGYRKTVDRKDVWIYKVK